MKSGYDAIEGGAQGEHRAGALAKGGLHAALVEHDVVGGERAAQETLRGQITTARGLGAFGVCAVESAPGWVGQLDCWEHHLPLARYALIADGERMRSAMYPGSILGPLFAEQMEINVRQHAPDYACSAVRTTAWLDADQQVRIMQDMGCAIGLISGGCFTAIADPDGRILGGPVAAGEGEVVAHLDFARIDTRERLVDARAHYSRPELLSLLIDRTPASPVHERAAHRSAEALRAAADGERAAEALRQQPLHRSAGSSHWRGNIARDPEGTHQ